MFEFADKMIEAGAARRPGPLAAPRLATVFLVEDNPLVRRLMHSRLNKEPDLVVCGEAEGAEDAFEKILALRPKVAVVDLGLYQSSGLDLIPALRVACPWLKIMVFSMHYEFFHITQALRAGADAYVPKEEGIPQLIWGIRRVLRGALAPMPAPLT